MRYAVTIAALATTLVAMPANAANVVQTNWSSINSVGGPAGVLRDTTWSTGNTPANQLTLVDGVFAPTNQQWNNGSWWWDEQVTNVSPFYTEITLNAAFTFDRLVIQADDNDAYNVDYWNGSAWQNVWTAPAVFTFGLVTRDSGTLGSFTTDRFRLSGTAGDQYYAISEFQAFGTAVPEPATWGMMILGFGAIGGAMRRRRSTRVSFG